MLELVDEDFDGECLEGRAGRVADERQNLVVNRVNGVCPLNQDCLTLRPKKDVQPLPDG